MTMKNGEKLKREHDGRNKVELNRYLTKQRRKGVIER